MVAFFKSIYDSLLLVFLALLLDSAVEKFVELFLISFSSLVLYLLLELIDVLNVLPLLLVLLVLFVSLNSFVELLVFYSLFAFFEVLDLNLLL